MASPPPPLPPQIFWGCKHTLELMASPPSPSPPPLASPPPPPLQICWGCKHTLELMASGDTLFGSYYAHEPGGSPSWLFQVRSG